MAFGPEIDVTAASSNIQQQQQAQADANTRKRVLFGSFFAILLIGLIAVWVRSPIYQSSALVQLTFPDIGTLAPEAMAERAFAVSERKLQSEGLQNSLLYTLHDSGYNISGEQLAAMLSSEGEPSQRMLTLYVRDQNPELTLPVIEAWLALYLEEYQQQQGNSSDKNQDQTNEKLADLEARLAERRQTLAEFSTAHDVSSIEQDENRALNKMKNVTKALNQAEQQQIEAAAQLKAIEQAKRQGSPIASPDAKQQAQKLRAAILAIEQDLTELSERFTDKYMSLDPDIVKKTRKLEELQQELADLTSNSAALYEAETRQNLVDAKGRVSALTAQREELRAATMAAKERLADYRIMNEELVLLENQIRAHKAKLIDLEVVQSDIPRVDVLEYPSAPTFPIGPNYWLHSLFVLIAAVVGALVSLQILALISVRRPSGPTTANYTIVQNAPAGAALGSPMNQQLEHQQDQHRLAQAPQPQALNHTASAPAIAPIGMPRQLTTAELMALLGQAPEDGKLAMAMLLCGVAPTELMTMNEAQFDLEQQMLHLTGRFQRSLKVPQRLIESVQALNLASGAGIWDQQAEQPMELADINAMLLIAAEDAQLEQPQQVNVDAVRHSYLCFIAEQGCKLSELESMTGYIPPKQLSWYRAVASEPVAAPEFIHPALNS
ncbi:hypothetical protein IC617_13100 [Neiella sp. HB171785]|uniref:Uncharacterized protein n=1 Tax=Neiella litorisoli TaxID=2771431 RepID=A0A8J6QVE2_9GAMM|nr:hypothetical protein [Neiella litorisoli]MBD1390373.1 hypothetical protein [Neiella litorisoli]